MLMPNNEYCVHFDTSVRLTQQYTMCTDAKSPSLLKQSVFTVSPMQFTKKFTQREIGKFRLLLDSVRREYEQHPEKRLEPQIASKMVEGEDDFPIQSPSNHQQWMNFYRFLRDQQYYRIPPHGPGFPEPVYEHFPEKMQSLHLRKDVLPGEKEIHEQLRNFNSKTVFYHD